VSSQEALTVAGLNWQVLSKPIYTEGQLINGYRANVRDTDNQVLGIVSDRYSLVQNTEAFEFTNNLLGEGVTYEKSGELQNGRRCYLIARLPNKYIISGEEIAPYIIFYNSHDGSTAITVAVTPVRIVCMNMLNLALKSAVKSWSIKHIGNMQGKLLEAQETLSLANKYMTGLGKEIDRLNKIKVPESKVISYINELTPLPDNATAIQKKNVQQVRDDMLKRYFEAPDLKGLDKTAYRFTLAISDHATHSAPLRKTENFQENHFMRSLDGLPLIDKAHALVRISA
jgi:phage/plasmid-like protein (TIGR03299 family)